MPSFQQVVFRLGKVSRQRRPKSFRVPALILRFFADCRMSFSERSLSRGISSAIQHQQQNQQQIFVLGVDLPQSLVQLRVAGPLQEQPVEVALQERRLLGRATRGTLSNAGNTSRSRRACGRTSTPDAEVNRRCYRRTCQTGEFDGLSYLAFFVDPDPRQGPEEKAYLVVLRTAYTEQPASDLARRAFSIALDRMRGRS